MTNSIPNTADDDLLKEYDFSKGVRGKYVKRSRSAAMLRGLKTLVALCRQDSPRIDSRRGEDRS